MSKNLKLVNMTKKSNYLIWEEIEGQKSIANSIFEKFLSIKKELSKFFKDYERLFFIGCGSSYHVSIIGNFLHDFLTDKKSYYVHSSDFMFFTRAYINKKPKNNDIFLLLSRSSHTTETVITSKILKQNGLDSISISSISDGDLIKNSKYPIILNNLKEEAITATKSVVGSTMFILYLTFLLANKFNLSKNFIDNSNTFYSSFYDYASIIEKIILKNNFNKFVFLGSGPYYGVAREAELKVKEMSLSNTEAFQTLEYRHGHKSVINSDTLIIFLISNIGIDYELKVAQEFKELGANTLLIGDRISKSKRLGNYDYLIDIDLGVEDTFKTVFYQLFGQLIGYYQAIKKGIDPTKPKNLDYYVTINLE